MSVSAKDIEVGDLLICMEIFYLVLSKVKVDNGCYDFVLQDLDGSGKVNLTRSGFGDLWKLEKL